MQGDLKRPVKYAVYSLTWYDAAWDEIQEPDAMLSADEMIRRIEIWNSRTQFVARDASVVVLPTALPAHVSIGVHYVER